MISPCWLLLSFIATSLAPSCSLSPCRPLGVRGMERDIRYVGGTPGYVRRAGLYDGGNIVRGCSILMWRWRDPVGGCPWHGDAGAFLIWHRGMTPPYIRRPPRRLSYIHRPPHLLHGAGGHVSGVCEAARRRSLWHWAKLLRFGQRAPHSPRVHRVARPRGVS